jgi:hypothetical protein
VTDRVHPEFRPYRSGLPGADEFGVPQGLLGPHPPDVWGAIGRTVALAALLEDRLIALLQTLTLSEQSAYATLRPTQVIEVLRGQEPPDDPAWAEWATWLTRAADAFEWRNHVVHNLWPAQSGRRLYGHRLGRLGERIFVDTTREELMERLVDLARTTVDAQSWMAMAGAESVRRWHERARANCQADDSAGERPVR